MAPLHGFVSDAKRSFLGDPIERSAATVYIGNSAGDLDTIASSICAAYVRAMASGAQAPLHVPVIPFARADFRLRQDAVLLFKHCGFVLDHQGAPRDLLFWDEVQPAAAGAAAGTAAVVAPDAAPNACPPLSLVLTDHNRITPSVRERLGEKVVGIIDHHQDEGFHTDTCPPARRTIDTAAGSACSLVAAELQNMLGTTAAPPAELCALLLGTIVADCRGFDPAQRRYDSADISAARWLLGALGAVPTGSGELEAQAAALRALPPPAAVAVDGVSSLGALAKRILSARFDVSSLSASDLLKLDYKQASSGGLSVGVAAIFVTLDEFIGRCGGGQALAQTLTSFGVSREVDVLVALTAGDKGDGKRKGILLMATSETPAAASAASALRRLLEAIPADLPSTLAAEPLYQSQRIIDEGFGIRFARVEGAVERQVLRSPLRPQVTRKTVLPVLLHGLSLTGS